MDESASADWDTFERSLADVLSVLTEDQYLVLSRKRGTAYVQFAAQGAWGMRAETVSDNYLPPAEDLSHVQVAALTVLGWSDPTGSAEEGNPTEQPGGSPNYFRDFSSPVVWGDVARFAVRTFREVHQVPHPGNLNYSSFDSEKRTILLPTLRLKHRSPS